MIGLTLSFLTGCLVTFVLCRRQLPFRRKAATIVSIDRVPSGNEIFDKALERSRVKCGDEIDVVLSDGYRFRGYFLSHWFRFPDGTRLTSRDRPNPAWLDEQVDIWARREKWLE